MYLLDTNVISELRKTRAEPAVVAWARSVAPSSLYISVITVLEIEIGVLARERRHRRQADLLRRWLEKSVLHAFRDRILDVDLLVVRRWAHLHVPNPRNDRDALIAATALAHNLTVVTRNVQDFAGSGAPLLNPWAFGTTSPD